jgi:hypothetical protein
MFDVFSLKVRASDQAADDRAEAARFGADGGEGVVQREGVERREGGHAFGHVYLLSR